MSQKENSEPPRAQMSAFVPQLGGLPRLSPFCTAVFSGTTYLVTSCLKMTIFRKKPRLWGRAHQPAYSLPGSSRLVYHPRHTQLSSRHREPAWSLPEPFHTLVPSPGRPTFSSSSAVRKPSLRLPLASGCPSPCSSCTLAFQCHSTERTIARSFLSPFSFTRL